jgi:hypothetical protein
MGEALASPTTEFITNDWPSGATMYCCLLVFTAPLPTFVMPLIGALATVAGHAQDGNAPLEAAARALGATQLTSIQYSGNGTNNAFGRAYLPGGPWPTFKVTSYTAAINQAGVKTTFVGLEEVGLVGNGHQTMSEKNSDGIAKYFMTWLEKNVR